MELEAKIAYLSLSEGLFFFVELFFSVNFYFSRYRRRKIKLSELNKQWELLAFEPLFFQRKCLLEPQENNQET